MKSLSSLFGPSPFAQIVQHARKVHECVELIRPIADGIAAQDMEALNRLHNDMSSREFEADRIKDLIRECLSKRVFLPVEKEDLLNFIRQMDRVADDAEDFSVVATFRPLTLTPELRSDLFALVDRVLHVSERLMDLAESLADLERESFEGPDATTVLEKIQDICRAEWETDVLSRAFARRYYGTASHDPVTVMLLEKLCKSLTGIADHAENVGKSLRLLILRK